MRMTLDDTIYRAEQAASRTRGDAQEEQLQLAIWLREYRMLKNRDVDLIPLKPLAEWLAGYAAPPRDAMRAAMQDGHITPGILRQAWEQTLREIRWDDIE